jgi:hypothetical protein
MTGYSWNFDSKASAAHIENMIEGGCPWTRDKILVDAVNEYGYYENGRAMYIQFVGYNNKPGQFKIVPADLNTTAYNYTTHQNVTDPFSNDLFYEPIPYEMLRTNVKKTQLRVTVNGTEAVCKNLNCDYIYTPPVGEITSFSFDATNNQVTINGNLSSIIDATTDIRSIEFAKSPCKLDEGSVTNNSLTCTLERTKTCGNHLPILTTKMGIIPVLDSLTPE